MHTTKLAIYDPPAPDMPMLAVVVVDGELLACEPVYSKSEGELLLSKVRENLPEFITEARLPQA